MHRRILMLLIAALATMVLSGAPSRAQEDVGFSQSGPLAQEVDERRSDFESRYDFDQWRGKDRQPLDLSVVDMNAAASDAELLLTESGLEPTTGRVRGVPAAVVEYFLWPQKDGTRVAESMGFAVDVRMFPGAQDAQNALMDSLASPLRTMPPLPGSGPAYGEEVIRGVGDVCLAMPLGQTGYGRVDCVVANVWFTLQLARPKDVVTPDRAIADRAIEVAATLAKALESAGAAAREAGISPSSIVLQRAAVSQQGEVQVLDPQPVRAVVADPSGPTLLAIDLEDAEEFVRQTTVTRRAVATAGEVQYRFNHDLGLSEPAALRLSAEHRGNQKLYYLIHRSDGVFHYLATSVDIE